MAARLSKRCQGGHIHQPLLSGRAKNAAFYPLPLVTEILRGITDTSGAEDLSHNDVDKKTAMAVARAGMMHVIPPSFPSVVDAQQNSKWSTTVNMIDCTKKTVHLADKLKDGFRDEYTRELLPSSWVHAAMHSKFD